MDTKGGQCDINEILIVRDSPSFLRILYINQGLICLYTHLGE